MARGVRRTHTEKLQSELSEVRAAISQYEDSLDELRSREKEINSQIEIERFKEVSELLKQRGMTLCDLKELLSSKGNTGSRNLTAQPLNRLMQAKIS